MNAPKAPLFLILALLAWACLAGEARAHKVNVFAVVQGGQVMGEGYFSGGGRAMNCPVEILDAAGAVVASAVTGPDGAFSAPLPAGAKPPLKVVLKAGEGHQNDYTLTAADMGAQAPASAPAPAAAPSTPVQEPGRPAAQGQAPGGMDEASLTALVEAATARAVEEKLAPLRLELARMAAQDGAARLRDIVGGLGWIIGLVGVVAWFKRPGKK